MKLSVFSRALPLIVLAVNAVSPSCADSSDGGINRFFPHGEPPSGPEGNPNRVIVHYKNLKGLGAVVSQADRVHHELAKQKAVAVTVNDGRKIEALWNNPNVVFIETDALRYVSGVSGFRGGKGGSSLESSAEDHLKSTIDEGSETRDLKMTHGRRLAETTPYGIGMVQADQVSYVSADAPKLCIIDSGYDGNHEDLPSAGVTGSNDGQINWNEDTCSHGTHVAGTIAALGNNNLGVVGVINDANVRLHIVKVFDGTGCGWSYSSNLIAALNDCIANGANVVSMSLGGSWKSRAEETAFRNAYQDDNVLSIAAAGNNGGTRHSYPASYDDVVSVGALDFSRTIADFSRQNNQVELSAPGVAVRSTVKMGGGSEESVVVGGTGFEATAMVGSPPGTGSGNLFRCNAEGGLGSTGDCTGADGKVCLISRGDITFAEKVLECQAQGGTGAIIFNNAGALFSGTLGGAGTTIQSVGVSGTDGAILGGMIGNFTEVTTNAGNYAYYDGTSMACPHVSAVAALVWSNYPLCSAGDIRVALQASAQDLGPAGKDNAYGYGLVQARDAFDYLAANPCGGGGGSCDPAGSPCGNCCDGCSTGGPPSSRVCL